MKLTISLDQNFILIKRTNFSNDFAQNNPAPPSPPCLSSVFPLLKLYCSLHPPSVRFRKKSSCFSDRSPHILLMIKLCLNLFLVHKRRVPFQIQSLIFLERNQRIEDQGDLQPDTEFQSKCSKKKICFLVKQITQMVYIESNKQIRADSMSFKKSIKTFSIKRVLNQNQLKQNKKQMKEAVSISVFMQFVFSSNQAYSMHLFIVLCRRQQLDLQRSYRGTPREIQVAAID